MPKIGRNDMCFCGSQKKYKHCHLDRDKEEPFSSKRYSAGFRGKTQLKECMHPLAGKGRCNKKIIYAHSIQRKGPLRLIVDEENHVGRLRYDDSGDFELERVGWQKASTFNGFCKKHDKEMFSVIEDNAFEADLEQVFVLSYRSLAHEYYKKKSICQGFEYARSNIDRGLNSDGQVAMQSVVAAMESGYNDGVLWLEETLAKFQRIFIDRSFSDLSSVVFHITGEACVVFSGCISPSYSTSGNHIQNLTDKDNLVESFLVNSVVTENNFAIVFTWHKSFLKISKYMDELMAIDKECLPSVLVELLFFHLENVFFSEKWFLELDEYKREALAKRSSEYFSYSNPIFFSNNKYNDWKVEGIEVI